MDSVEVGIVVESVEVDVIVVDSVEVDVFVVGSVEVDVVVVDSVEVEVVVDSVEADVVVDSVTKVDVSDDACADDADTVVEVNGEDVPSSPLIIGTETTVKKCLSEYFTCLPIRSQTLVVSLKTSIWLDFIVG